MSHRSNLVDNYKQNCHQMYYRHHYSRMEHLYMVSLHNWHQRIQLDMCKQMMSHCQHNYHRSNMVHYYTV